MHISPDLYTRRNVEKNTPPCLPLCERLYTTDGKIFGVSFVKTTKEYPHAIRHVHTIVSRMPLPITEENIAKAETWLLRKISETLVDKA